MNILLANIEIRIRFTYRSVETHLAFSNFRDGEIVTRRRNWVRVFRRD